jgi:hypothetical protein
MSNDTAWLYPNSVPGPEKLKCNLLRLIELLISWQYEQKRSDGTLAGLLPAQRFEK